MNTISCSPYEMNVFSVDDSIENLIKINANEEIVETLSICVHRAVRMVIFRYTFLNWFLMCLNNLR